jgi:hypothetical protein
VGIDFRNVAVNQRTGPPGNHAADDDHLAPDHRLVGQHDGTGDGQHVLLHQAVHRDLSAEDDHVVHLLSFFDGDIAIERDQVFCRGGCRQQKNQQSDKNSSRKMFHQSILHFFNGIGPVKKFMADIGDNPRHDGYDDNRENHQRKVAFNRGNVAEKISAQKKSTNPRRTADNIIQKKLPVCHGADAGHKGSKRADDGHEPGDDNRFSAVFFIKRMGLFQVLLFEKAAVLVGKYLRTDGMPDGVIDAVSGDAGNAEQNQQDFNVQRPQRRQGAQGEQKGIAGQDRRHHKAGFTKYNYKYKNINPCAKTLDNSRKILVEVNEEIYKVEDYIHIYAIL